MADFHLDSLVFPPITLVPFFAVATVLFGGDPGGEQGGGVEVVLEVAKGLGGGDAGGFVDGWVVLAVFLH